MDDPHLYEHEGLHVEVYDAMTHLEDVPFYRALAERAGGRVLELGCGTGRAAWELARAGHTVVGLDRSGPMLARAESKRGKDDAQAGARIRFVRGDMAGFALPERFRFAFSAFRAFQALLSPEDQRACLRAVHDHLEPGGLLALDLFDPQLHRCVDGDVEEPPGVMECVHPVTGNRVTAEVLTRRNDAVRQMIHERWRFAEHDADGNVVREEHEILDLRWTYRWELRHLLDLCGFEHVAEYSDYAQAPPRYGAEQIHVARRR